MHDQMHEVQFYYNTYMPKEDDYKVIAYLSLTRTDVETRYCPLECECLGILFRMSCQPCRAISNWDPPPPLAPSTLPPSWHTLNIDFLGPFPNGSYLLVVVDQRSKYPEVEIIGSTASTATLGTLNKIFSSHGLSHKVITDNGSPFQSQQFKTYMQQKGICHHRITPLHPKANSTAENFMGNLNKAMYISSIEGQPWCEDLYDFLLNYRIAKHVSTDVSPAEALFHRKI